MNDLRIKALISAHGEVQQQLDLLLEMMQPLGWSLEVLSPETDPVETRLPHFCIGKKGRTSPAVPDRMRCFLEWSSKDDRDFSVLLHYDSPFLRNPGFRTGFRGIIPEDPTNHNRSSCFWFPAKTMHIPFTLDSYSASLMLDKANAFPDFTGNNHDNVFLTALAGMAGVPSCTFPRGDGKLTGGGFNGENARNFVAVHGVRTVEGLQEVAKAMKTDDVPWTKY